MKWPGCKTNVNTKVFLLFLMGTLQLIQTQFYEIFLMFLTI